MTDIDKFSKFGATNKRSSIEMRLFNIAYLWQKE